MHPAHSPPDGGQLALAVPADPGRERDPKIVASFGMGVESSACLLSWLERPETRDFDLSDLLVITAMTGNEWEITGQRVRDHILPRLREHNIRYVQVARRTGSQSDGIVVLDDSRHPDELHLDGAYRLSEELTEAGTIPQVGGARQCSAKAKGWPIDTFLATAAREPFRQAVGFHTGEHGRARRDATYDTPRREGFYPLIEWGWDRQQASRFIEEVTGVAAWPKSACIYCPFALTNKTGRARVLTLFDEHPDVAVEALMLEHRAVCLNPTQGLIAGSRLHDLFRQSGRTALLARFDRAVERAPHTLYEVRRIRRPRTDDPERQANASRHLQLLAHGTRRQMLATLAECGTAEQADGIPRVWLRRRAHTLPCGEHYLVAGPSGAVAKGDRRFEDWWAQLTGTATAGVQLRAA
jgi:hypothetical protein